jgi:hypothetical protein
MRVGDATAPMVLVLTPDGDLLFVENASPSGSRLVPLNAARQEILKAAIARLK